MSWFVGCFGSPLVSPDQASRVESGRVGWSGGRSAGGRGAAGVAGGALGAHGGAHAAGGGRGVRQKRFPCPIRGCFLPPFFRVVPSRTVQLGSLDLFGLVVVSSFYLAH